MSSSSNNSDNDESLYEYVFGFGSIINSSTHAAWLEDNNNTSSTDEKPPPLQGQVVRIRPEFGYERRWNFRSTTGFTALGVSATSNAGSGGGMNGVLFRVPSTMMPGFDRREVGYDKVQIPLQHIEMVTTTSSDDKINQPQSSAVATSTLQLQSTDKIWIYVPQSSQCLEADENHPLLQSYVDTVLQGCLEWGGQAMAEEFILTTGGWSSFFLNDTPSSRRPWLFRKDYDIIDRILQKHSQLTRYADRRHPEQYSYSVIRRMRGTWSIPRRNRQFTGRDDVLRQIHARLTTRDNHHGLHGGGGGSVQYLFVVGMGGVGKSSVCVEYCYRNLSSFYGLIIWLNAESAETLMADYRQLLADLADVDTSSSGNGKDNNSNSTTEEVIGEVKTRLFRCKVSWLLVFDNLEDRKLLDRFVPRGGSKGHVLVTSRVVELLESGNSPSSFVLGCLSPSESLEMLRRSIGSNSNSGTSKDDESAAAKEICEKLGHLPLALGMAAAYMQRCDVSCVEYVERYVRSEQTGRSLLRHQAGRLHDYALTVSASLALSLKAIEKESKTAFEVLRLLCWLGPDHITKAMLRALLATKNHADEERSRREANQRAKLPLLFSKSQQNALGVLFLALGFAFGGVELMSGFQKARSRPLVGFGSRILASVSLAVSGLAILSPILARAEDSPQPPSSVRRRRSSSTLGVDEFEQSDIVWNVLKSFSILTVREGKGSMHRLLAQALRVDQLEDESCYHLQICIGAMQKIWRFDPRNADTWQDSFHGVEHVKALVLHCSSNNLQHFCTDIYLQAGLLSKQAGVFSAMAMNGFKEAEASYQVAIQMFDKLQSGQQSSRTDSALMRAKAEALCELGKAFRYQGSFEAAEETLLRALRIRSSLSKKEKSAARSVADTLHELGVLEVKKHLLDTAEQYLTEALDLRRTLDEDSSDIDADCAATLHQLATVHVARKPPNLRMADELLKEALKLSRQIGQRAATLKQLARVSIRQGSLDTAEEYLRRALELYVELYGERTMHINVAAVKFQQGALAFQREQFEQAWIHFSECLRIRRHVYAYTRPVEPADGADKSNPLHLEVSCVLHELGCVAFAQARYSQAMEMLQAERSILQNLEDSTTQTERLRQALLTNLTWLRKCAQGMGDESSAAVFAAERVQLKNKARTKTTEATKDEKRVSQSLQREALRCREAARQYALSKAEDSSLERRKVLDELAKLDEELVGSPASTLRDAVLEFSETLKTCVNMRAGALPKSDVFRACDRLRDALRAHGAQVNDLVASSS